MDMSFGNWRLAVVAFDHKAQRANGLMLLNAPLGL
jgi:hypothetical protein